MPDVPVSMVDRLMLIMSMFEGASGSLTLGQVSVRSGVPRSSAHRILQQLVEGRWLQRVDGQYVLGLRVFEIGSLVAHRSRISTAARPYMHDLCRSTSNAVHLAILDGSDVVYLEKVGGMFASRLPSRVGGRLPAHCTAVGKAILSFSPRDVIDDCIAAGLHGRTTASISNPDSLDLALAGIRRAGYATESDEAVPGVACVAAPIIEAGRAVAGISVCGPREQVLVDDLRVSVMRVAAEVSRRLSGVAWPIYPAA